MATNPWQLAHRWILVFASLLAITRATAAAEPIAGIIARTILRGLRSPCCVAVRPDGSLPSEVFVADRGAGRVVRVVANRPDVAEEAVVGFPTSGTAADQPGSPGIQSIYFLDPSRLAVVGGNDDHTPFIRLYELQDLEGVIRFADHKQAVAPTGDDARIASGIRSFHDLARTRANDRVPDALLLAATAADGPVGLWKVAVRANTLGELSAIVPTNENAVTSVGGIAVSNLGYVVIAAGGNDGPRRGNTLRFLSPADARVLLELPTELPNIVGLAYSPTTGNLYAANVAAGRSPGDGIYRLQDSGAVGHPACHAEKVANIDRPTALAFGPDGTLYVSALAAPQTDQQAGGQLHQLSGDL